MGARPIGGRVDGLFVGVDRIAGCGSVSLMPLITPRSDRSLWERGCLTGAA
jgi:hypothetical protein